jgi:hypothetical protein
MTTKAEVELQTLEIMELLLPPNSSKLFEIIKICKENWKCSEATVRKRYTAAIERIKHLADIDRDYLYSEALVTLNDLYNRSYEIERYRDALEVIKEKNKLLGLNAPEKKDISIKAYKELSDDDLKKIIGEP